MKKARITKNKATRQGPTLTPKGRPTLTIREMRFAAGVVSGLSATEAMRQAGYKETTALKKQSEKLEKVGRYITELMDERGLTDEGLIHVLDEGLRATKRIPCTTTVEMPGKGPEGEPSTQTVTRHFVEVEDHAVRHRYLETALKLKGYLSKVDYTLATRNDPGRFDFGVLLTTTDGKTRKLPSDGGQ